MRITIATDGGLTGRGLGSAAAETDDDLEVRRAFEAADPGSWRDEYAAYGRDLVRYTLTAGEHRVSWSDGATLPGDLRRLFDAVWRRR